MISIGAIALILGWSRVGPREPGWTFYTPYATLGPGPANLAHLQARTWFEYAIFGLSALTVAQVAFRLLPPRPKWRRLMCQPGWIACLSATPVMSILVARHWIGWAIERALDYPGVRVSFFPMDHSAWFLGVSAQATGMAVVVSWLILRIGGRWRSEPGWVDRMGRTIGVAWIVTIPIEAALEIAAPLYMRVLPIFDRTTRSP